MNDLEGSGADARYFALILALEIQWGLERVAREIISKMKEGQSRR